MSRAERLLQLMQLLRRHRVPVSGAVLAAELGVSLRTLYRDIAALQAQGATLEGEPGVGYLLRPGFLLPPLMLSQEEIEALVLGARWVAARTDLQLAGAAGDALAKIRAVLPAELRHELETSALLVPARRGGASAPPATVDLAVLRQSIRDQRKLRLAYADAGGRASQRVVWPFALGFFEDVRMLAAWCETREDFRHFRLDRMTGAELLGQAYPRRRQALLKEWLAREGIAAAPF